MDTVILLSWVCNEHLEHVGCIDKTLHWIKFDIQFLFDINQMVVVVCTSQSENSTQRSQLFTQFAVVSAVFTSQNDIFSQWEIVKKFDSVQNNN